MAFTMSLDDFVISYFVTGSDFIPLPVEIYSYVKKPLQPKLYAMFTLLFLLILVLMIAMNVIEARGEKKKTKQIKPVSKTWKMVRSICAAVLVLAMLGGSCYGIVNMIIRNRNTITLNVYNWGQYMARGDDGSRDLIKEFEAKYPHIRVNYVTYDSNEVMYSKLAGGGDQIDVIIPSDYMIARLVEEDMLEELNFDNIPNYKYIDEQFKNQPFDPENKYSVPYTWGTVGIIYNKNVVDE
jgi:spermidine/putrescine transport system permease protein